MSQEKAQLIAPIGHFTVPGLNVAGVVTATSFSGNCTGTASSITKGASLVVGVMTASSFVGDVTGNVTGIGSNTDNLDVGIVTATSFAGNFTGIGSGLTGTPNVVAGVVTATKFVGNTPGTVSKLADGTNINVGVVTATKFVGNTSGLAGGISAAQNINVGVLTATGGLYGDGSGLTGAGSTAYIRQSVGSGTTIDLNNGNIIYFNHVGDTTVSFANTSTADDVTFIRPLTDPTAISISTGGVDFDGTGDFLSLAASTDFTFGTGAFTIEFWFKVTDNSTHQTFISEFDSYNYQVEINTDGKVQFAWGANSTSYWSIVGGTTISEDTWYHVAVVRNGNNFTQYLNGVNDGSFSSATSSLTTGVTRIGRNSPDNRPLTGVISNLRIVKGTAVYTTDFYPPSTELTNVADTKLLCCQSDSSTTTAAVTPGTITANGDPTAGAQTLTLSPSLGSAITWPTGVTWNGGSAPTLLGANSYSLAGQVFNLVTYNGGTNWYGYEEVNNNITATSGGEFSLYAWGQNQVGELGVNSVVHHSSPIQIPGDWDTLAHSTGQGNHNTVIKSDGTLWVFGNAPNGQLGQNDRTKYSSPVQVPGTTWTTVGAGDRYTMATKSDGTLWSWGYNLNGRLGQNDPSPNFQAKSSPVQIPGTTWGTGPYQLGPLGTFGSAIKTDGTLWMWGKNDKGQLGQNNETSYSSPKQVPGTTWRSIGGGYGAVLATKTDNTLWAWGYGGEGQLAQNSVVQYSSPVQIPGTTWGEVTSYGGWQSVSVIKTDGTLWNWGNNDNGSAGQNNTNDGYSSPVQVPGTTWKQCDRGDNGGVVAVKTDGTLWSWGRNNAGQGGRNDAIDRSSPVQIPGTGWHSVNQNTSTAFALKS